MTAVCNGPYATRKWFSLASKKKRPHDCILRLRLGGRHIRCTDVSIISSERYVGNKRPVCFRGCWLSRNMNTKNVCIFRRLHHTSTLVDDDVTSSVSNTTLPIGACGALLSHPTGFPLTHSLLLGRARDSQCALMTPRPCSEYDHRTSTYAHMTAATAVVQLHR